VQQHGAMSNASFEKLIPRPLAGAISVMSMSCVGRVECDDMGANRWRQSAAASSGHLGRDGGLFKMTGPRGRWVHVSPQRPGRHGLA